MGPGARPGHHLMPRIRRSLTRIGDFPPADAMSWWSPPTHYWRDTMTAVEDANRALVIEAFDALFNRRDYVAAEALWSPDYIQHSAHIPPGRSFLLELVKSLPAEPPAPATSLGADPSAEPSLLMQAFTRYLLIIPGDDDTESIRAFNDGQALEGISGYSSNLGGVPAITLEPLVGKPKRVVVYYHGGGYIS